MSRRKFKTPKKDSQTPRKKDKYRIRNWRQYNQSLINRGSITFWFNEDAIGKWHTVHRTGKKGRPDTYSDDAIRCGLMIRAVFRTALRTLQGCLWVVPGGHATTLRQLFVKDNTSDQLSFIVLDSAPLSDEGMVPVEMKKGSLLLIHSLLPHKSLANHSSKSRIAYTFHIIDRASEYPSSNWLQRGTDAPLKPYDFEDRL